MPFRQPSLHRQSRFTGLHGALTPEGLEIKIPGGEYMQFHRMLQAKPRVRVLVLDEIGIPAGTRLLITGLVRLPSARQPLEGLQIRVSPGGLEVTLTGHSTFCNALRSAKGLPTPQGTHIRDSVTISV